MKNISMVAAVLILLIGSACKKSTNNGTLSGTPNPPTGGGNGTATDPATAATIGFFMDDWKPKILILPTYNEVPKPTANATATVTIDANTILTKVVPDVYSHNANSWAGQMVTEPVLMNHLTNLKPNILRFPGGSLSDVYFWNKQYNSPPSDAPAQLLDANGAASNANYWGGQTTDAWTISLNNYYAMLQQTGNQGMITVNYGYARYGTGVNPVTNAAHLAADWVRYDNGRTKYWEIGNECNGTWEAGYRINTVTNADGQPAIITGALYGQHVKVFVDSMKKAAQEIGKTIYIGTYILEAQPAAWQTPTDQNWNTGVLPVVNTKTDYYIIHSYYTPYQTNANAATILNTATDNTKNMFSFYQTDINSAVNITKPIALTEYNITSQGSKQQVSFVNGLHAAIVVGESIKNKYGMASRWDLVNSYDNGNDHGLFNSGNEPGVTKWNPRPAFYFLYYFQKYMGDRLLQSNTTGNIIAYSSSFTSGEKATILINKNTTDEIVSINLQNATAGARYYWYTLTGGTDNGEFSPKVFVNGDGPTEITGGPSSTYTTIKANSAATAGGIKVNVPARAAVYLVMDK